MAHYRYHTTHGLTVQFFLTAASFIDFSKVLDLLIIKHLIALSHMPAEAAAHREIGTLPRRPVSQSRCLVLDFPFLAQSLWLLQSNRSGAALMTILGQNQVQALIQVIFWVETDSNTMWEPCVYVFQRDPTFQNFPGIRGLQSQLLATDSGRMTACVCGVV